MRFKKIKFANEEVELVYSESSDDDSLEIVRKCKQEPTPEFQAALKALHRHVPRLTDLPEKYLATAEVTSLHLSYDKDGDRSAVSISVKRPVKLSNSPLVFTTPNFGENETTAGDKLFDDIDTLCRHARGYVNGERSQVAMFEGSKKKQKRDAVTGQLSIGDDIEAEKKEGARIIRAREAQAAFAAIMGPRPDVGVPDDIEDPPLADIIMRRFDEVVHVDNEGDPDAKRIAGLYRWQRESGAEGESDVAWCQVNTDGGIERYWFDVPPMDFDQAAVPPTATHSKLVRMLREAWGLPLSEARVEEQRIEDAGDAEAAQERAQQDREAAIDAYRRSVRPSPMPEGLNVTTAMVMQAIHTAIFDAVGAPEMWFDLQRTGCDDVQLMQHIFDALNTRANGQPTFRFNEPIGLLQDEKNLVYHNAEFTLDPVSVVVGKGRKRESIEGDRFVKAVRAMLNITEVEAAEGETEGAEDSVAV